MARRRRGKSDGAAAPVAPSNVPATSASGRWRLGLLLLALLFVSLAAVPAYQRLQWRRYVGEASQLLSNGEFDAAVERLAAAERSRPGQAETQYLLARAHRRAGRVDRFAVHLQQAKTLGYASDLLELQNDLALCQAGSAAARQSLLADRQNELPDDLAEEVFEAIAQSYLREYDLREAAACLEYWLQWRPDCRRAKLWRADLAVRMGVEEAARKDYEQLLQEDPQDAGAAAGFAALLLEANEVERAVGVLQPALAKQAADVELLLLAAQAQRRLTRWDDAAEFATRTLQVASEPHEVASARYESGQIALANGRHEDAVREFQQALELQPASGRLQHAISMAYGLSGQRDLSQKHLQLGRELDQRDQRLIDLLQQLARQPDDHEARLEAAALLEAQGNLVQAANWFRLILAEDPQNLQVHEALARIYTRQGETALAQQHLEQAAVLRPAHPTSEQ